MCRKWCEDGSQTKSGVWRRAARGSLLSDVNLTNKLPLRVCPGGMMSLLLGNGVIAILGATLGHPGSDLSFYQINLQQCTGGCLDGTGL